MRLREVWCIFGKGFSVPIQIKSIQTSDWSEQIAQNDLRVGIHYDSGVFNAYYKREMCCILVYLCNNLPEMILRRESITTLQTPRESSSSCPTGYYTGDPHQGARYSDTLLLWFTIVLHYLAKDTLLLCIIWPKIHYCFHSIRPKIQTKNFSAFLLQRWPAPGGKQGRYNSILHYYYKRCYEERNNGERWEKEIWNYKSSAYYIAKLTQIASFTLSSTSYW